MSDTNTTTEAPKAPDIALRSLIRNESSFTPVWQQMKRGSGAGVFYPAIVPTRETWDAYIAFKGLDAVIDLITAKESQDAQTALNYICDKNNAWIETYKQIRVKKKDENGNEVETLEFAVDSNGEKIVEKVQLAEADYRKLMPELLDLLEKGSIRGGVTMASLRLENEELTQELMRLVKEARKDPTLLVKAAELTEKIQANEANIETIKATRKQSRLVSE